MSPLQEFRQYQLSENTDRSPLELGRSEDEVVCLAFDTERVFFVEMHVLASDFGDASGEGEFLEKVRMAMHLRSPHVVRIFDAGQDEGTPFYVTAYTDGELLTDYITRAAPLPPGCAVDVVRQLLSGLRDLGEVPDVLRTVDVLHARVTRDAGAIGNLRVVLGDLALSNGVGRNAGADELQAAEQLHCENVARLLIGCFSGTLEVSPADVEAGAIDGIPGSLRRILGEFNEVGGLPVNVFLERMESCVLPRTDGRERMSGAGDVRSAGFVRPPVRRLAGHLQSASALGHVMGAEFSVSVSEDAIGSGYSFVARDRSPSGGTARLELLPPRRLCQGRFSQSVQRAMTAAGELESSHLMRAETLWGDPDGDFFSEPVAPGSMLSDWVSAHDGGAVPLDDSLRVLEGVHLALAEASRAGFQIWGLAPKNIVMEGFRAGGGNFVASAADESLVRLRVCPTLAQLVEPWRFTCDGQMPAQVPESPDRYRAFLALAHKLFACEADPHRRGTLMRMVHEEAAKEEVRAGTFALRGTFLVKLRNWLRHGAGAAITSDAGAEAGFILPPTTEPARADDPRPSPGPPEPRRDPEDPGTGPEPARELEPESVVPGPEPPMGLAEALFREEGDHADWNPVARAMFQARHDDPGEAGASGDADIIGEPTPESLEDESRGGAVAWAVTVLVIASAGLAAAVAHFLGLGFWVK